MTSISEDRQQQLSPGLAVKVPCSTASTGVLVLSGEQTVDGVACVEDDRVLVKNQASSVDNGIYLVSTGSWSRAQDFDGNYDVTKGTLVLVNDGSSLGRFYRLTSTDDPIVIGTSAITFELSTQVPVSLASFPQIVDSIAALKALANPAGSALTMIVRGSATLGDGGARIYWWNVADATAEDGVSVVAPNAGTGRWNLLSYLVTPGKGNLARNIAIGGRDALTADLPLGKLTTGLSNIAIGSGALKNCTTGSNQALGDGALRANTTGNENLALGGGALSACTTGNTNVSVGGGSSGFISTGSSNVVLGVDAMHGTLGSEVTGSGNTAIGTSALQAIITTAANNTAVGSGAGILLTTGNSNVLLGCSAAASLTTESNAFYLDNQARGSQALDKAGALMYGNFSSTPANQLLQINAQTTLPLQPAFLANATTTANATGDATNATVIWGTEVYDQNADFAANTFTAPVTGRYHFSLALNVTGMGAGHTSLQAQLVASNRTITFSALNPAPILLGGGYQVSGGIDVDMDAGDTATISLIVSNSTKTVGYNAISAFSGRLAC